MVPRAEQIFDFLLYIVFLLLIFPSRPIKSINDFLPVVLIIPELLDFSFSFPPVILFLVEVVPADFGTDF